MYNAYKGMVGGCPRTTSSAKCSSAIRIHRVFERDYASKVFLNSPRAAEAFPRIRRHSSCEDGRNIHIRVRGDEAQLSRPFTPFPRPPYSCLVDDGKTCNETPQRLEGLMTHDDKVLEMMVEELSEAKEKHAVPRRTLIMPEEGMKHDIAFLSNC